MKPQRKPPTLHSLKRARDNAIAKLKVARPVEAEIARPSRGRTKLKPLTKPPTFRSLKRNLADALEKLRLVHDQLRNTEVALDRSRTEHDNTARSLSAKIEVSNARTIELSGARHLLERNLAEAQALNQRQANAIEALESELAEAKAAAQTLHETNERLNASLNGRQATTNAAPDSQARSPQDRVDELLAKTVSLERELRRARRNALALQCQLGAANVSLRGLALRLGALEHDRFFTPAQEALDVV